MFRMFLNKNSHAHEHSFSNECELYTPSQSWKRSDRNFTGWNFWLFGRVGKKSAQNTCFLIIYSTVLCKKIDYVGCLLHALLNYLIFCAIFSKNYFSPDFSPVGHLFPTGSSSAPSLFYIQPPKAATLATVIYLEWSR
jgi:hypothetical protein